ncbi:Uncharacterised protein [Vibrio cholerae]|nr:Uncharacterised protein [Vibrio cholerae]
MSEVSILHLNTVHLCLDWAIRPNHSIRYWRTVSVQKAITSLARKVMRSIKSLLLGKGKKSSIPVLRVTLGCSNSRATLARHTMPILITVTMRKKRVKC